MKLLKEFTAMLCGSFDNSVQLERFAAQGITGYPEARHVNTRINDHIDHLPEDFAGEFVLEESYYTVGGRTNAMPHLFLFTEEGDAVKLTSYDLPDGKKDFTYASMQPVDYAALQPSAKFTPALFRLQDGVWSGGSESMFAPGLRFTLSERFSADALEVSETMERDGKRIFGYDRPIIYRRKA